MNSPQQSNQAPGRPAVPPMAAQNAPRPVAASTPARRTYYSRSQNLVIHINPGKEVHDGSKLIRLGQKHARFGPLGGTHMVDGQPVNGGFGILTTDDPELIEKLDRRIIELGDIMDETRFSQASKSPAMLAQEATRTIESQNKLIAELQSKLQAK